MVLAAAKAAGAAPLIAIDKIDERLEAARQVGADITLNPIDTDIVKAVVDITEAGLDVVFACVSFRAEGILEQAFEMVRRRGRVILVGQPAPARLHTGAWLAKEVRIQGALHMGQEMVTALKLLQYKRANVKPSITEIIPLEEAQKAFDSLHEQRNIAVLLKP
jgi:threonine dehydrogenase-like Zn-dependent dehydrogenase